MNENRTTAILQRFAVILAVTAASYGLQPQAQAARTNGNGSGEHHHAQSVGQQR